MQAVLLHLQRPSDQIAGSYRHDVSPLPASAGAANDWDRWRFGRSHGRWNDLAAVQAESASTRWASWMIRKCVTIDKTVGTVTGTAMNVPSPAVACDNSNCAVNSTWSL